MPAHRLPHKLALTVAGVSTALLTAGTAVAVSPPALAAGSARLVATPGSVSFGSVTVGSSAGATVTVANTGPATTGKALSVQLVGGGFSVVSNACSGIRLRAGGSCAIRVSFEPASAGSRTATLQVTAGALRANPVTLTGTAVTAARLAMTPATQSFPDTVTGTRSDLVTFTVTNTGGTSAGAIATSRPGPDFALFADTCSGVALAPQASCTYSLAFTPQSRGAKTGTLIATASPGDSAQASLTGTGLAAARLGLTGGSGFPDTAVGAQSDPVSYTVTNNGDQPSGPIIVAAFSSPDFTVAADRCSGQSLAPSASCGIDVRFTPRTFGARADVLSVSAVPGGGVNLPLSGTALGTPHLTMSPDDYTFPDTHVLTNSLVQVFKVTNDGTGPAWFNSYNTSSTEQVYFYTELAPEGCDFDQELDPGQSCNVAASALPEGYGPQTGTLYADFVDNPDGNSGQRFVAQAVLHVTGF